MNFYTPLYLDEDYDSDGLADLVTVHGGDPTRKPRMLITGKHRARLTNASI
jgi:hypothetical protein